MINNEKLKDARDNLHLTQKSLGEMLGISESGYCRYEKEKDAFPIKHLLKVCGILNISLDYIFDFVNFENYMLVNKTVDAQKSGNRLKEFRKEKQLSQEELAKKLNVERTTISGYENGKNLIASQFLFYICKEYHLSADYLIGRINEPKYLINS